MNIHFESVRETRTMETLISQLPKIAVSLEKIAKVLEKLVEDKTDVDTLEEIDN